jgi:hypothetical protein
MKKSQSPKANQNFFGGLKLFKIISVIPVTIYFNPLFILKIHRPPLFKPLPFLFLVIEDPKEQVISGKEGVAKGFIIIAAYLSPIEYPINCPDKTAAQHFE